jgi:hypothetical protein
VSDWFEVDIHDMSPAAQQAMGTIRQIVAIERDSRDAALVLQALLESADAAKIGHQIANRPLADCDDGCTCDCEARRKRGLECSGDVDLERVWGGDGT